MFIVSWVRENLRRHIPLIIVLFFLVFIELILVVQFHRFFGLAPIFEISAHDASAEVDAYSISSSSVLKNYRMELIPLVGDLESDEEKVKAVLMWVMNSVHKVENFNHYDSWSMFQVARSGRGLLCGGMAEVFKDALQAIDVPSRVVVLKRDVFGQSDTHATVEAFIDGVWRIFDPTFHLTLVRDGIAVGAIEAREWFVYRKGSPVEKKFLGEVSYPARIEEYYINFDTMFDNVFIKKNLDSDFLLNIPYVGNRFSVYYLFMSDESDNGANYFYQKIWVLALIIFPFFIITILSVLVFSSSKKSDL